MIQARRHDRVTGGAEINFGGAREVYLCEFERGTGAREIYPSLHESNEQGESQKFKGIFRPKTGDLQKKKKKNVFTEIQRDFAAEIRNSNSFSGRKQVISKKRKRSSSQKCHEIRCQSTKITKIPLANTILGLDLHSSSPEPVNFFGAQSSVGGAQFSFGVAQAIIWGARPGNAPRVAGPDMIFVAVKSN